MKIESRYLRFCYEFSIFIRCMQIAFYRPDYQKFLIRPLIQRLGRVFVSKHTVEPLKRSSKLLKHSAACLCYNTTHAVPISHGKRVFFAYSTNSYHTFISAYFNCSHMEKVISSANSLLFYKLFYMQCFFCLQVMTLNAWFRVFCKVF